MSWFRRAQRTVAVALLVGVVAIADDAPGAKAASRNQPPNIVVVVTDDQTLAAFSAKTMPETWRLLVQRGSSFTNAIVTTPLCCPSRAAFLTGQYGHNNGVLHNNYRPLRDKHNTLPVWLSRAGYRTAHVGKYLNNYTSVPGPATKPAPGWQQWRTLIDNRYYDYDMSINGRRVHFGTAPRDYATRVLGRQASAVVRRYASRSRPLYLQLDEWAPHTGGPDQTGHCAQSAVPDPRDADRFQTAALPQPPSFNEAEVGDKPSFIRRLPLLDNDQIGLTTRRYRCALASLRAVDRSVGKLYRELREAGEVRNTVFLFTTDNGVFSGEHRIMGGKQLPYEEAVRVPLVMRVPGRFRRQRPSIPRIGAPVANIDLAPTLLRIAGAKPCKRPRHCRVQDGRSLLGVLRGRTTFSADRGLGLEIQMPASRAARVCAYHGIRIPGTLYVDYTELKDPDLGGCVPADEHERYDLSADPYELDNRCTGGGDCPADSLQNELISRLDRLSVCAGIAGRDPRVARRPHCE
jgi:N-acetylglucosamine-6-sulfatase